MKFNILKKNRKYYAATNEFYKCKILIDENSEKLELGEIDIDVDDISIKSKYGTDFIYKLKASVEDQSEAGICSLKHFLYNRDLVTKCRQIGGRWDGDENAWIFKAYAADKVEELDYIYNSHLKTYEITFVKEDYAVKEAFRLFGYVIAVAKGRDTGAITSDFLGVIEGGFTSGGSAKNWTTIVEEGTTIRIDLPALLVENEKTIYPNITIKEYEL